MKTCPSDRLTVCTGTYYDALQVLSAPYKEHTKRTGWGGIGIDFALVQLILPSLLWGMCLYFIKIVLQRPIEHISTLYFNITPSKYPKRLRKLKNQCWLLAYYLCSTFFGVLVLRREKYFRFPINIKEESEAAASLYAPHPQPPSPLIVLYYNYEIGFYFCEIFTVFINISWGKYFMCGKRMSTIFEAATHHIFTLFLLLFSHMGYYHRVGSYVLFLHDASDVLLCVSKITVYLRRSERIVNINFFIFVLSFIFLRLYCLPMLMFASLSVAVKIVPCTVNHWCLFFVIHFFIQSIHIYWFVLIMKIAYRAVTKPPSTRSRDIRSSSSEAEDEEEEEEEEFEEAKKEDSAVVSSNRESASSRHTGSGTDGRETTMPPSHLLDTDPLYCLEEEEGEEGEEGREKRNSKTRRYAYPIASLGDCKIDQSLVRTKKRKKDV